MGLNMAIMTSGEAMQALLDQGCMFIPEQGYHFKGISGRHLNGYFNIDPAMPFPRLISKMTEAIIEPFTHDDVEVVFAPAVGAIPMAHWGSHHLSERLGKEIPGIWADKLKPRGFRVERAGFAKELKNKRVLILEDMINQMFSVRELVRLVQENGGEAVGVGSVASHQGVSAQAIGVPKLISLVQIKYEAWDEESCELCTRRVPMVVDIGHGDDFVSHNADYPSVSVLSH
jgi:orotate phosphoribosyltransferase